ncbi:hypothetical protein B0H67DRAFT_642499 [Lasiosphaeris hirsuta]|uniref:Uncharacterized protein n=1 Tax=Lasiosphaeris hirsuta TaxID=260670 RepID=A0AA40ANM7_9PEZI|nr:hypothetical protein B0H67DRAFT_642499 [Lasiosphaeris hirsuta]
MENPSTYYFRHGGASDFDDGANDFDGGANDFDDFLSCGLAPQGCPKLDREETELRAKPAGSLLPADVFNTSVGQFWGILDTRNYMRARFAAADALLKVETRVAVKRALGHFMEMLRLCRADNLGVRDIVPTLLLRLGREQECYDFLKWWATADVDGKHRWGDTTLPYLDIYGADAFEPIEPFLPEHGLSLSQLAMLTLLKLRLYLDLEAHGSGSGSVVGRPVGWLVQAKVRYTHTRVVNDANPYFWEALVDGETPLPPASFSAGSKEEAGMAVRQCKSAWEESEDAMVMIEADTLQYVSVYTGPAAVTAASASNVHVPPDGPENREENKPSQSTSSPSKLFSSTPLGRGQAKAAADKPAAPESKGVMLHGPSRTMTGVQPGGRILELCLEHEGMFDGVFGSLVSQIRGKATVERATTVEATLRMLNQEPAPAVILVADGAVTRQKKVRERVIDRLREGATVALAGCFSSTVSRGGFNSFFASLGLPWQQGSYYRTTVSLCLGATSAMVANRLPASYSQKALFVKNIEGSAAWYTEMEFSNEAAVACTKVGLGSLGYVGDVNGEMESDEVRFEEAVKNLVGDDQYADLGKTKGYSLALKSFDREVKRSFRDDPNEEHFVNFPMVKDLKAIFAPLITDTLRLVDDQVKSVKIKRQSQGVTGIFLVGGFGNSQYLKAKMTWFINIGDDIARDQKIKCRFYRSLDENYGLSELVFFNTLC